MTPLRKKMIRELELQRKAKLTIRAYVRAVEDLSQFYGRSPERISVEEVRDFLHHLITQRKVAYNTCNQKLAGILFFYRHVLRRTEVDLRVPAKRSGRLPEPLGRNEVRRVIEATANTKHRVLLMTAYGGGLRASELVSLELGHIHSDRLLIRVNQGKGHKDRYTLLSERLLEELRDYWREYRPKRWLFPNPKETGPIAATTAQNVYDAAKKRANIQHGRGLHTLRHSFATHLMEGGVPIPVIQCLLGHASMSTTAKYLHVTSKHLNQWRSPLDLLRLPRSAELLE